MTVRWSVHDFTISGPGSTTVPRSGYFLILIDTTPGAFLGLLPAAGTGIAPVPVPLPPGLTGLRLLIQGVFTVGATPGLQLTDAIDVRIL